MDGLSQAFSSFFSNPGDVKLAEAGVAGVGEAGNILEQVKRMEYQNFILNLLKNPQLLANMAAKITAPLNANLVQSVTNQVQGNVASRGLAQSPGIFAATESEALAPYEQQNQNAALQAVLSSLGLPANTFQSPQNLGPIMSLLFSNKPLIPTQSTPTPGLTPPSSSGSFSYPTASPDDPSNWEWAP